MSIIPTRPKRKRGNEQILKRKNFLPTLFITTILWLTTVGVIYFVDPGIFGAVFFFFILAFLTMLFTFSLIFASGRRGLICAVSGITYLFLSYVGVGNYLNLILIVAIAFCVELYFSTK